MKLSMKRSMLATTVFSHGTRTSRIRAGLHGRSERSVGAATDVAERHGAGVPSFSGNARGTRGTDHPFLFLRDPRYPIGNLEKFGG